MTGFTRSGRSYRLVGPPGADGDADFVKVAWLRFNGFMLADATPVAPEPIGAALH